MESQDPSSGDHACTILSISDIVMPTESLSCTPRYFQHRGDLNSSITMLHTHRLIIYEKMISGDWVWLTRHCRCSLMQQVHTHPHRVLHGKQPTEAGRLCNSFSFFFSSMHQRASSQPVRSKWCTLVSLTVAVLYGLLGIQYVKWVTITHIWRHTHTHS